MTPQIDNVPEQRESRLSTADLASTLTATKTPQETNVPLFAQNDTQDFRARWEKIQIGFVDEPRKAVEQADELVASAIKRLAEVFAAERNKLEGEWDKSDNVSTEDLRVALRRYRSFFDRLLSV
jgi:hypothetical protein